MNEENNLMSGMDTVIGYPEALTGTGTTTSVRGNLLVDESDRRKEYTPNRIEILRNYQVSIKFLSIGCIIEVGCKSIPFQTIAEGMKALNDYVNTPHASQKIWEERFRKEEQEKQL